MSIFFEYLYYYKKKIYPDMYKIIKTGIFFLLLVLVILVAGTGCASERKAKQIIKSAGTSTCDLSHLGKNKYYYSPHYKKRLASNIRHIRRR